MAQKKAKLKNINLDEIEIGDRFREHYDLSDLLESIPEVGVLQPISVRELSKGKYRLLAGGRRIKACLELDLQHIPANVINSDSTLSDREVEFLENQHRKDLHWYEKLEQTVKMHKLYVEQNGEENWSQNKTAKALDKSVGGINRALQLYSICQEIPELKEESNEDKAVKLSRKLLEGAVVHKMVEERNVRTSGGLDNGHSPECAHLDAVTIFKEYPDEPIFPDECADIEASGVSWQEINKTGRIASEPRSAEQFKNKIHVNPLINASRTAEDDFIIGDAFEGLDKLAKLEEKLPIWFVEVDPPYGIDLKEQKKGEADAALNTYNEVARSEYEEFTNTFCRKLFAALPDDSRIVYWYGHEYYSLVTNSLKESGFKIDPIPCIWVKEAGQTNSPDLYLGRTYEPFIVATKGDGLPIRQRGRSNVFQYSAVPAQRKYHPTQRPIELIREILRTFAFPDSLVLCPFLGSGTTLRAAYQEDMSGFGWELNDLNKKPFLAAIEADIQGEDNVVHAEADEEH